MPKAATVLPFGGALNDLAQIFADWTERERLGEGDATELLMCEVTPSQREWLSAFVDLWDAEQARLDAR